MSAEKVIQLHAIAGATFDFKNIKTLDGRYRCLVRIRGYLVTVILCTTKLAPSRDFIQIGDFYSDQVRGWFPISEIEVVEILAKVKIEDDAPKQLPWWKRFLLRLAK